MKQFIVEQEYKGMNISSYLKEIKGFSSRSMRNIEILVNNNKSGIKKNWLLMMF